MNRELKEFEDQIFKDGNWFKTPICLLRELSPNEILILGELINLCRMNQTTDWVLCQSDWVEKRLYFNRSKQHRLFSKLIELDLIQIKREGKDGARWVKVDFQNVILLVEDCKKEPIEEEEEASVVAEVQQPKHLETPSVVAKVQQPVVAKVQRPYIKEDTIKNNKLSPSPKGDEPRGGFFDIGVQREKDVSDVFAERLYDLLSEKRLIFRRPSLKAWATEIRGFINLSGYSPDEIDSVLNWYKENVSSPYTPQAFSAKSFCEKFGRLFVMMNRPVVETQHERNLAFAEKLQQEAALKRREEEEEAKKPKELVYVDLFPKRKK